MLAGIYRPVPDHPWEKGLPTTMVEFGWHVERKIRARRNWSRSKGRRDREIKNAKSRGRKAYVQIW